MECPPLRKRDLLGQKRKSSPFLFGESPYLICLRYDSLEEQSPRRLE